MERIHLADRPRRMRSAGKDADMGGPIARFAPSASRAERSARLTRRLRFLDTFRLVDPHPRLSPAAVQIIKEGQERVDERADLEAQPDRVRAQAAVRRVNEAEADGHQPNCKD